MRNICYIIILFLAFAACKKEDNIPPVVEIIKPESGNFYVQGDTIFFKFKVSDDEGVTSVKASIVNSSYQSVYSQTFINAGKSKEYEGMILTEAFAITGNTHHFVVTATDGESETKTGRQIFIELTEKKSLGVYVASSSGSNSYEISYINQDFDYFPLTFTAGDFLNLEVSSKDKIIFHSGKYVGDLYARYHLGATAWTEPAISVAGNPAFHNISLYDDLIFVGYDNETVKAYDKNKNIKFSANLGAGNYAVNFSKNNSVLLIEQHAYPFVESFLIAYHFDTGTPVKSVSLGAMKLKNIFIKDNDEFILIGNENNSTKIFNYNYSMNVTNNLYSIPAGDTIITAEHISSENLILLQLNSGLYQFNISNNNLISIMPGSAFNALAYDNINKFLIAGSGNNLNYYNFPQLQLFNTVSIPNSIRDIEVIYSR